jgi:uncharacterized membrane protein YhhN
LLTVWFWLMLLFAVVDWVAVAQGRKRVRYITKPGALLFLIFWFARLGGFQADPASPLLWFGLGLVFSLAGDVFLLPPDRFFTAGLGAFLLGHLCYLVGFNLAPPPLRWESLLVVLVVAVLWYFIFRGIRAGLRRSPENAAMLLPVAVYSSVIALMLISALLTFWRPGWPAQAALAASAGAALFFTSDSVLAYDRFVERVRGGELIVMVTYHLGQFGIVAGALMALG